MARWGIGLLLWLTTAATHAQDDSEDVSEEEVGFFEEALRGVVEWAVCFFVDLFAPVIEWVFESIPDIVLDGLDDIMGILYVLEAWIPLTLGISLLVSYYTFLIIWIIVRYVAAAIPTIG